MTSHLAALAIDSADPEAMAEFWCAALGWTVLERDEGIVSIGPEGAVGAGGAAGPTIDLLAVADRKVVKNRLHIDLRADRSTTQADELARLEALGATRADVGQADDVTWVVLADPEGNEFCLL